MSVIYGEASFSVLQSLRVVAGVLATTFSLGAVNKNLLSAVTLRLPENLSSAGCTCAACAWFYCAS